MTLYVPYICLSWSYIVDSSWNQNSKRRRTRKNQISSRFIGESCCGRCCCNKENPHRFETLPCLCYHSHTWMFWLNSFLHFLELHWKILNSFNICLVLPNLPLHLYLIHRRSIETLEKHGGKILLFLYVWHDARTIRMMKVHDQRSS